ncbi:MAG: DNA polymerase III subunit beta [Patescibacteria group bacterium]|jgi:DNA polymerase-3 subunit beta
MKIACTQENLAQGLSMVSHATTKNVSLPVLGNVLLKTVNGSLQLSATNLEIAVGCLVRGKVDVEGEYSVPAKLLQDYVSLLPSGKVDLELKEDGLEVRSNGQETIIRGMAASEFPLLPKLAKGEGYRLPAEELKRAIGQVAFAASTSESRPELTGVSCVFGPAEAGFCVTFAATDSYRLAERRLMLSAAGKESKCIVPTRSMLEIARILSSYKDEIGSVEEAAWAMTESQLVVTFGNVELVTRLIEGSFPPYQEIIPKGFKTEALLPRTELQKAVRAASLFSRQGMFDIHLSFDPATGAAIQSADQGTGKTKSTVAGDIKGDANAVTLNYRYLNDGLAAMGGDKVNVAMIDAGNPVLVLPESEAEGYRYLVMPIRQ